MRHWMRLAIALVPLVATNRAEAQLGGLIKKKVADAVKPKEEQKAANQPEAASPFKYELTAETMAAFKRALELEARMRKDLRADHQARVAKYTAAKAAYEKCGGGLPSRPEASKIAEEASSRMDNAKTPDETRAAMEWMQKEMAGLRTKVCGAEPGSAPEPSPDLTKAQEAGAIEFGKGATRKPTPDKPSGDPPMDFPECLDFSLSIEDADAARTVRCGDDDSVGANEESREGLQGLDSELVGLFLQQYALFKEVIIAFCSLDSQSRATAVKNGIRVQGSNDSIYWVFSQTFAFWVNPYCGVLMALLTELE
jgi:hypothetical protein